MGRGRGKEREGEGNGDLLATDISRSDVRYWIVSIITCPLSDVLPLCGCCAVGDERWEGVVSVCCRGKKEGEELHGP